MNINSLIKAIKDTNITFYKPTKVELLVFDQNGINTISPFLKKKYFILKTRGEEINLYVLIYLLINFKKINYINYINSFIELVNPKFIVHHSVNDKFFQIKKYFPKIITIFIQNQFLYDTEMKNIKKGICNYSFLWGRDDVKRFTDISINKPFLVGSVLNNSIKNLKIKYNKTPLFISQFRVQKSKYWKLNDNSFIEYDKLMEADKFALKLLSNYFKKKKQNIFILCASKSKQKLAKEKEFYIENVPNNNIKFLSGNRTIFGYQKCKLFKKIFFINSTLGFECLAQKKDCFFFNFKNKFVGFKYLKFPLSKNGSCWSDSLNEKILLKKIEEFMNNKSVKNFNKNNKKYYSRIIYYDYKNNILKKNLRKIFKDYG